MEENDALRPELAPRRSVAQVAERLRVSPDAVLRMVRRGKVPTWRRASG